MARHKVLFSVTDDEGEHGPGSTVEVDEATAERWIRQGVIAPDPIAEDTHSTDDQEVQDVGGGKDGTAQDAPGQPQNEPADAPAKNKKKA